MLDLNQSFDVLKITNGFHRGYDSVAKTFGVAKKLGCTGSLGMDPDIRTITKKCEGVVQEEVTITNFYNVVVSGHMTIGVLRDIFGLSNEGLKPGVYAIGNKFKGKKGIFTWEAQDLYGTDKKLMAYPNMAVVSGFAFSHENGADEIAEIEITFKAMADTLGNFYYEAYESELTDEQVKTGWAETFTQTLVELVAP